MRSCLDIKENKKYWVAGILEGEGSFQTPPPSEPNIVRVTLQMTDEDIVKRVKRILNCGSVCKCAPRNENWSETWRLTIKGNPALELMKSLKPLMGERRTDRIDEVLKSHDPEYWTRSRSDYNKKEVLSALELIEEGLPLKKVSEKLNLKYQFVRDLSAGRTWKHLTT